MLLLRRHTVRFVALTTLTAFVLPACSDGTALRAQHDDGTSIRTPTTATPMDPPDDDPRVSTNPQAETGMDVGVDVAGLDEGNYQVSIVSVDGKVVHSTLAVKVAAGEDATSLKLELPPGIAKTEDQVLWNVQIERASDKPKLILLQSLLYFLSPVELNVRGPAKITAGKSVAYRVQAREPRTRAPLANRTVRLEFAAEEATAEDQSITATTDESGAAVFKLDPAAVGAYSLRATAVALAADSELGGNVAVEASGAKVLLTTDKPIYKPGQTIQLRALALDRSDSKPLKDTSSVFEVRDGKGNLVFKRELNTNDYGIVTTPFTIGRFVNEGNFEIRVRVGSIEAEKSVQVAQYALPKFKLTTTTEKPWYSPGETIRGVIDAHYFFGKAVDGGSIDIDAATVDIGRTSYAQVMGKTRADGRYEFTVATPSTVVGLPLEQGLGLISLQITATDTAGQQVSGETLVRIASQPLSVSLVPEATTLVSDIPNRLHLFVTDPLGAPVANAHATIRNPDAEAIEVDTDVQGYAEVLWTPGTESPQLSVSVSAGSVEVPPQVFQFSAQNGAEHLLLRADKSVYDVGDTASFEVLTSDAQGSVFVDWLNEGQAVDLRTLETEDGKASFTFTLDNSMLGENRVEAYIVDDDGSVVRTGRTIFVRKSGGLNIAVETDQDSYEPGAPAKISFKVTDETGEPAAAALGVQIVDEAVFGLVDARSGLLQTYFELDDAFSEPTYELHPPIGSLSSLLLDRPTGDEAQAVQTKAEATLAALGGHAVMGLDSWSWPQVVTASNTLLQPYLVEEQRRLLELTNDQLEGAVSEIVAAGCTLTNYWCDALNQDLPTALSDALAERVSTADAWGNAYDSTPSYSALLFSGGGPDEIAGTSDDISLRVSLDSLDFGRSDTAIHELGRNADAGALVAEMPALGGNFGDPLASPPAASAAADHNGTESPPAEESAASGPRVRSDFPETLFYNAALIADGNGEASISLDLADSITEWRISTLANSQHGRLGSSVAGLTVFQDFFVDIDFPATLTRGDDVSFPVAIYNYLDEAQTVNLELESASWFTALGGTALSVELEPGEVKGVSIPVRVEQVGLQSLTVRATGQQKSDAVARTVRVVPDGKTFSTVHSGTVDGNIARTVSFDAGAVPGSNELVLQVFPTFLSQAVTGLDSMLQVPSGCFEQTTANAWPNVLVADYLKKTDQATPEILLKAESLMSAGYQRLLTFEHPGGGFSWFGTQDPAPFLSVTAFGLMEFSDMKQVQVVDEAMLQRTLSYLLSRQAADGSWAGDQSEFFSFHTSVLRNTAFTLMAIGSAQYTGPETDRAVDYIASEYANAEQDAYTLALIANALALVAPEHSLLTQVLDALVDAKRPVGDDDKLISWDTGGTQTQFYSSGSDADVSTTALVTHALLLTGGHSELAQKALAYLTSKKDSLGNYGSTQATVWTLKTLLLAATKGTDSSVGTLTVEVDGEAVQSVELTEAQAQVMRTIDLTDLASSGNHEVTLSFIGEGKPSYSLVGRYNMPWVDIAPEPLGPLSVSVEYDRTELVVDETVQATVHVVNNTAQTQNMALVTLGLPPGFALESSDFDVYLNEHTLSKVEQTGKQILLYVSTLTANQDQVFTYRLRATMPVTASDGGSSVYPYYQPEEKSEAPARELSVAAL